MSTNTNTDLTEEDAADLQFPKESVSDVNVDFVCLNCTNELNFPFILCAECDVLICCECFARGSEFGLHKNDHSYSVMRDDFVLFPGSDWSAREELKMIEEFDNRRNLESVVRFLPGRNYKDVLEHYERFYVDGEGSPLIPTFSKRRVLGEGWGVGKIKKESANVTQGCLELNWAVSGKKQEPPYKFKVVNVQEPPRYAPNSANYNSVAGYNAPRADFEIEYDTNAEDLVANLKPIEKSNAHCNVLNEMQCSLVKMYNRRLEERRYRKTIIRNHGLILLRKTTAWLHRYDVTISPNVYERLVRFMKFYSGEGFEYMMEGLHKAGELRLQIARLCDYHKQGIETIEGARLYVNLKQKHEDYLKDLRTFHNDLRLRPLIKSVPIALPVKKRSVFTPLDVIGMPGYEQLQPNERELCRTARLVPLSYLELKETLIAENNKMGCLKLLTARKMLKIDVNKTRRLYDFLVAEGFIQKPKPT